MKKVIFLCLVLLAFYLSAMYRLLPLMLLCLAELFFAVCMWILSRYLKKGITAVFPEQTLVQEKNTVCRCDCSIINSGKLPVSRFRVRIRVRYLQEMTEHVKYLYGTAESGTNNIQFGVCAPYCGLACLKFEWIQIYDYLGLFSCKNELLQEVKIVILPPGQPLQMELGSSVWSSKNGRREKTSDCSGDAYHEIRQIREYQTGDSCRHIHWNQSARTDKIWIKEYEKETGSCIDLLLEIDAFHWADPQKMDAFYRLLHSILLGMLQKAYSIRVHWYDGHPDQLMETDILEEIQCQDLFFRLYQAKFSAFPGQTAKALLAFCTDTHGHYFKLDSGLRWYLDSTLIYEFSVGNLEQEIIKRSFRV